MIDLTPIVDRLRAVDGTTNHPKTPDQVFSLVRAAMIPAEPMELYAIVRVGTREIYVRTMADREYPWFGPNGCASWEDICRPLADIPVVYAPAVSAGQLARLISDRDEARRLATRLAADHLDDDARDAVQVSSWGKP